MAASSRRRRFLLVCLLASAGFAFGARDLPLRLPRAPLDPEPFRRTLLRALPQLYEARPQDAKWVQELWEFAERVTREESEAFFWERSEGRAEAAWNRATLAALRELRSLQLRKQELRDRWQALVDRVAPAVALARFNSRSAGLGKREIAAAERAAIEWEVGRRLAQAGKYEAALEAVARAAHWAEIVDSSHRELLARFSDPQNLKLWRRWVHEAIEHSRKHQEVVLIVNKLQRRLDVYSGGVKIKSFSAELGIKGLRRKLHAGDEATPEGHYWVTELRGPGRTLYYKALMLDYPNAEDRARFAAAVKRGELHLRARIGGLIEIHGEGGQGRDWTNGCVALSNRDMDEVFALARVGTRVTIVGTS